jgi:hypothetical protein
VSLLFDSAALLATVEPFDVDDGRLAGTWGPRLYRIHVTAKTPKAQDTWMLRLRLDP